MSWKKYVQLRRVAGIKEITTDEEAKAHQAFIDKIGEDAVWHKVLRRQARG